MLSIVWNISMNQSNCAIRWRFLSRSTPCNTALWRNCSAAHDMQFWPTLAPNISQPCLSAILEKLSASFQMLCNVLKQHSNIRSPRNSGGRRLHWSSNLLASVPTHQRLAETKSTTLLCRLLFSKQQRKESVCSLEPQSNQHDREHIYLYSFPRVCCILSNVWDCSD